MGKGIEAGDGVPERVSDGVSDGVGDADADADVDAGTESGTPPSELLSVDDDDDDDDDDATGDNGGGGGSRDADGRWIGADSNGDGRWIGPGAGARGGGSHTRREAADSPRRVEGLPYSSSRLSASVTDWWRAISAWRRCCWRSRSGHS